jgi:hypothetical protein
MPDATPPTLPEKLAALDELAGDLVAAVGL